MKNGKVIRAIVPLELEAEVISKHDKISMLDTPKVYIKQQQGFDYVDEGYMRHLLNQHYPVWKWEIIKHEFIGDKAILVHGRLTIIDNGIERHFDSIDAHRIASNEKGYVDIGNDLKSANTDCFKVAVNRLCNVADDVYRKQYIDRSLTDKQFEKVISVMSQMNTEDADKVKAALECGTINKDNYNKVLSKLKVTKENKNE